MTKLSLDLSPVHAVLFVLIIHTLCLLLILKDIARLWAFLVCIMTSFAHNAMSKMCQNNKLLHVVVIV